MFNDPSLLAQLPTQPYAAVKDPKSKDIYLAIGATARNGRIHPLYAILAYAFKRGWNPGDVWVSHAVDDTWATAADGLAFLAATANPGGFKYQIQDDAPPVQGKLYEVSIKGQTPPNGQVLAQGDIFTNNAHGFNNIPRLYLLSALALEHKLKASVVALVVDASGLIVARGDKAYGESGCGHAEVKALFSIHGNVPARWMLFSTLKPCTMCAGLIQALAGVNDRQYWARADPSTGADYGNVTDLRLPQGVAVASAAKDQHHVRSIRLLNGQDFADRFSAVWGGRATAVTTAKNALPEQVKTAYANWCAQVVKPGLSFNYTGGMKVRFRSDVQDLNAKAAARGSIGNLANYGEVFERVQGGSGKVTKGIDPAAGAAVTEAFYKSSQYKSASATLNKAESEAEMGIIDYISHGQRSVDLRQQARNALATKFVKYGKTTVQAGQATAGGVAAVPNHVVGADARMQPIVDYLFNYLNG